MKRKENRELGGRKEARETDFRFSNFALSTKLPFGSFSGKYQFSSNYYNIVACIIKLFVCKGKIILVG